MALVLVVEDNVDERAVYVALLFYNGYEVLEAGDGQEAIQLAKSASPDVILMDVRLPTVNGLLTTEILRATPETESIPVICMTGWDLSRERAQESGCRQLLRKPIPPTMLVNAVKDALAG